MAEEREDSTVEDAPQGDLGTALSELVACETLAQVCSWAARWLQAFAGADAVLVWTQDPVHALFSCTAASGEGLGRVLRRTAPRADGYLRRLIRDHEPFGIAGAELLVTDDAWLAPIGKGFGACLALPFQTEAGVIATAAVLFHAVETDLEAALTSVAGFIPDVTRAIGNSLAQDKKTAGMLHAIERLTNLYDLSKAFGSTLEWGELTAIIARKAVDFANAEVASLWILESDEGEVSLGATAVNENYELAAAPDSIGASVVGDAIGHTEAQFENDLPEGHLLRAEGPFPIRSALTVPLLEDETPVGVLVIVNKRGRHPQFAEADTLLLTDLGHQAVRALHNARRFGAERRAEELDALLAVSREITSTLDLDRVMKTVANASAALVNFDRCAVAILQRGKLKLGAVSGVDEISKSDPSIARTSDLLEWVFHGGNDVSVKREENGDVVTDRPETTEKFRVFFDASGMKSFLARILEDEEGKLGVVGFESAEALDFGEEGKGLLQILINQATVALRNAQLYQQVPLAGFWKPLLEKQRKLAAMPKAKLRRRLAIAAVIVVAMVALPWNIRLTGTARVLPASRTVLTAPVPGVIAGVLHREGDVVHKGEVVAVLHDDDYRAAAAQTRSDVEIARGEVARSQAEGDLPGLAKASARLEEARVRDAVAQDNLAQTQVRAPADGVIITPHLEDRVGQMVASGTEIAVLADAKTVDVEVALRENDSSLLGDGQPVKVKLNAYPSRVFRGKIGRVSPVVHEEGEDRFVLADAVIDNPSGVIRPGMLGKAKVSTGTVRLGYAVLRKPARWFWSKLWPLMP
ncbi:MAG TPA: efflux RND transporter periplasmic adaptor subunit [Thermoanaerobaculia bacterium]|nr:efflux RND transporter periplasmic adaptor subunit [Thermoanaerobaculia bacterium]